MFVSVYMCACMFTDGKIKSSVLEEKKINHINPSAFLL